MSDTPTRRTDRTVRMQRVRRFSAVMALLCLGIAATLALGLLLYWVLTPVAEIFRQSGLTLVPPQDLSLTIRLAAFAVSMIPLAFLIYGLLAARRCFHAFASGEVFSETKTTSLRALAYGMGLSAITKPIAGAGLSLILSSAGASSSRSLSLNISSDTLLLLVFSGMVAIMAWVMREATAIADEHRQFV